MVLTRLALKNLKKRYGVDKELRIRLYRLADYQNVGPVRQKRNKNSQSKPVPQQNVNQGLIENDANQAEQFVASTIDQQEFLNNIVERSK